MCGTVDRDVCLRGHEGLVVLGACPIAVRDGGRGEGGGQRRG